MLEILAIIFLCRKNAANAAARGRKPTGFVWLTVGLWVGLELLGGAIGGAAGLGLGAYVLALALAVCGGVASYLITKNCKPGNAPIAPVTMRVAVPAQAASAPRASAKPARAYYVLGCSVAAWFFAILLLNLFPGRTLFPCAFATGLLVAGLLGAAAYLLTLRGLTYKLVAAFSGLVGTLLMAGNAVTVYGISAMGYRYQLGKIFQFNSPLVFPTFLKALLCVFLVLGAAALVNWLLRARPQNKRVLPVGGAAAVVYALALLLLGLLRSKGYPLWLSGTRGGYHLLDLALLPGWLLCATLLTGRLCDMPHPRVKLRKTGLVWAWIAAICMGLTLLSTLLLGGIDEALATFNAQYLVLIFGTAGYILLLCKRRAGLYFLLLGAAPMLLGQVCESALRLSFGMASATLQDTYTLLLISSLLGLINPLLGWLSVRAADRFAGVRPVRAAAVSAAPAQSAEAFRFCMSCGKRIALTARFCPACGTPVAAITYAPAAPASESEEAQATASPAAAPVSKMRPTAAVAAENAPSPVLRAAPDYASYEAPATPKPAGTRPGKKGLLLLVGAAVAVALITAVVCLILHNGKQVRYNDAVEFFEKGSYRAAQNAFDQLGTFDDAADMAALSERMLHYDNGVSDMEKGDYASAVEEFALAGDVRDARERMAQCESALTAPDAAVEAEDEAANAEADADTEAAKKAAKKAEIEAIIAEQAAKEVEEAQKTKPTVPMSFENSTYHVSVGSIALNEEGNRTVALDGIGLGGKIPMRNGKMIIIIQAKFISGGKTYGWENVNVSRDRFVFTFDTDAMPEKVYLYANGLEDDPKTQWVYTVATGEYEKYF